MNDQRQMRNTSTEITKYQHKRINTNNEKKSLKVKYTVKVIIFK